MFPCKKRIRRALEKMFNFVNLLCNICFCYSFPTQAVEHYTYTFLSLIYFHFNKLSVFIAYLKLSLYAIIHVLFIFFTNKIAEIRNFDDSHFALYLFIFTQQRISCPSAVPFERYVILHLFSCAICCCLCLRFSFSINFVSVTRSNFSIDSTKYLHQKEKS